MRPFKKAKRDLDRLYEGLTETDLVQSLQQAQQELEEKEKQLKQKSKALVIALKLWSKTSSSLFCDVDWSKLPPALRNDPVALQIAVAYQNTDALNHKERKTLPETVFQAALQGILKKMGREKALEACTEGFFSWEEVKPSRQEWLNSAKLSLLALRQRVVRSQSDVRFSRRE